MNSIEDEHICRPQIWRLRISSFVGGNPTLEIDKGERSLFPYKRGPFPPGFGGIKKGNHGPPPPKSGRPLWPLINFFFFGEKFWDNGPLIRGPNLSMSFWF